MMWDMAERPDPPIRRPLTGVLTIEWVESADPDDPSAEPNFGWSMRCDPQIDRHHLGILIQRLAAYMEDELSEG